jgi:hypothetical protein
MKKWPQVRPLGQITAILSPNWLRNAEEAEH